MGKHYWAEVLPKTLELDARGYTHRMVAEELGYTQEQIKRLIKRYHKKQREEAPVPAKRGRPRTRPISSEEEYKKRIEQLEMGNELLRSFLQVAGRRRARS